MQSQYAIFQAVYYYLALAAEYLTAVKVHLLVMLLTIMEQTVLVLVHLVQIVPF